MRVNSSASPNPRPTNSSEEVFSSHVHQIWKGCNSASRFHQWNVDRGRNCSGGEFVPNANVRRGYDVPVRRAYRKRSQRAAWRKRTIGFQYRALAARQPPHLQNQQRADFVFALRQLSGQHTDHSRQRKLRCDHRWRRNERMLGGVLLGTAAASDKILVLDGQRTPGGNANRDDAAPIPAIASTATAYAVQPYAPFLTDIYNTTGILWQNYVVPSPFYSYFFDSQTPYVNPGTNSWNIDTYGNGLNSVPYPTNIVNDLKAARQDLMNWYHKPGAPTDPADNSDPKYDYLSPMTFDSYLTQTKGFHPAVSDFYTRYAVDALDGTTAQTSAYTSISFLGAEYFPEFAYPGGNSGMLRHIIKWLIPGAINGTSDADLLANPFNLSAMDNPNNNVRIRQGAMVVRGDTSSTNASVIYFLNGQFFRATAKAVIFAGQSHTARTACAQLLSSSQADALDQVTLSPVVTANVTMRRAAPEVDLGYDAYYWGGQYFADFVVADWVGANRSDPARQTVLTFYGGNTASVEDQPNERIKLLTTPFSSYEDSLRSDMNRVLPGSNFDFDRDVEVCVYRWGHSMVYPKPGWPFGAAINKNGQVIR